MKKICLLSLFLVFTYQSAVHAQVKFSGMTQSSIYAWENSDENQLVDYYQHVNARVSLESYRDLYLKTYFRDLAEPEIQPSGTKEFTMLILIFFHPAVNGMHVLAASLFIAV